MFRDFTLVDTWITLVGLLLFGVLIFFFFKNTIKQKLVYALFFGFLLISIVSYIFKADILSLLSLISDCALIVISVIINAHSFRKFFITGKFENVGKTKNNRPTRLFDRDEVVNKINEAVQTAVAINKSKTYDRINKKNEAGIGMLICFERNDSLDDIVDAGYEVVNADVSARLLLSIFFEGTHLHDGAVIIRGNKIYAASAFLPPTNDSIYGKFGARHRAAKGVTEKCDCLALLVSEETGEITIFDDGDGISVNPEDFVTEFKKFYDRPTER